MQNDDLLERLKDNMNGRPGQPIVLGGDVIGRHDQQALGPRG